MKQTDTVVTSVQDYLRDKALGLLGLINYDLSPKIRNEKLTFINNIITTGSSSSYNRSAHSHTF